MYRIITLLTLLICSSISTWAQGEIVGQWNGTLEVQGIKLRLVFNVAKTQNGYETTLDSPDQGAKDIPFTNTIFENSKVKFEIPQVIEYTGELQDGKIVGTFKQSGLSIPLTLEKNISGEDIIKRPQEPKEPFPYHSENITFRNEKANITLAGTLTLPEKTGQFPAVILISGSGPQDRNSEILGHKPFLLWADYLTRNGIAVLRFDDRGFALSQGNFSTSTTHDFATDVASAVEYLKTKKEINSKKIGLIGHSEGGIIAPIVAASHPKDINFMVLLAGSGIQGDQLLLLQQQLIARQSGVSEEEIKKNFEKHTKIFERMNNIQNEVQLKTELSQIISDYISEENISQGMTKEEVVQRQLNIYISPWMLNFVRYNPAPMLEKVKCPVLAINGDKDLQVPSKENLAAIENALKKGKNKKVTLIEYPNLNHLFQEAETGLPQEYSVIEQTISPKVLEDVNNWIKNQTK